jgi:hypothetical protein
VWTNKTWEEGCTGVYTKRENDEGKKKPYGTYLGVEGITLTTSGASGGREGTMLAWTRANKGRED